MFLSDHFIRAWASRASGAWVLWALLAGAAHAGEPPATQRISIEAGMGARHADGVGMLGTQAALVVQPWPRHRLRLQQAYFSNDHGPAGDDGGGSSFGLGDFFSCILGLGCPDDGNAGPVTTGGNVYADYEETTALYQYRLAANASGNGTASEIWVGIGVADSERTTMRYRLNQGEEFDPVAVASKQGVAWEVDFVHRGRHWFGVAAVAGASSSKSGGLSLGFGWGF